MNPETRSVHEAHELERAMHHRAALAAQDLADAAAREHRKFWALLGTDMRPADDWEGCVD